MGHHTVDGQFGPEIEPDDLDRDDSIGVGADDPLPDLPDDDGPRVKDWDHGRELGSSELEDAE